MGLEFSLDTLNETHCSSSINAAVEITKDSSSLRIMMIIYFVHHSLRALNIHNHSCRRLFYLDKYKIGLEKLNFCE